MKRIFTILSIALLCGALSCPSIEARGRNNGGTTTATTNERPQKQASHNSQTQSKSNDNTSARPANSGNNGRPGNGGFGSNTNTNSKPNNNNGVRPGNNNNNNVRPGNSVNNVRPGNPGNTVVTRPGDNIKPGNPGNNTKPGNPGNNFAPGHGNNFAPGHGNNFGPGPGHNPGRPGSIAAIPNHAPHRPMMMPPRPIHRPVPPPAFRPGPRYPIINTILGVTIGTAINLSLDYLFNHGYYISGYTNNAVYLNDVNQLNLLWPNATLYYNGGRLASSEFVYSTPYYDTNRYYTAYNRLTNVYGMPISTNYLPGGGMECTWFGYDGQFVSLQYANGIANNGTNRYYTTLSFGI